MKNRESAQGARAEAASRKRRSEDRGAGGDKVVPMPGLNPEAVRRAWRNLRKTGATHTRRTGDD